MTREEFIRLAETWGGDIGRWPLSQREDAARFATTEEGTRILEEARRLDRLLSAEPPIDPARPAAAAFAVMQRIAAAGAGEPARRFDWLRQWALPAMSIACSLLIGVSLGAALPPAQPADQPETALDLILDSGTSPFWGLQ